VRDLPDEFMPLLKQLMQAMPVYLDELERLLRDNEILLIRSEGVGVLPKEVAVSYSVTGPMLRASGIGYDIRRAEPYSVYDQLDFDIPIGVAGDVYDRFLVRIEEIRQSRRILEQVVERLPDTEGGHIAPKAKQNIKPPVGEAYARIESPKGELGFYLVSDGSDRPYRYKVRAPSLINLTPLRDMCRGYKVADIVTILGSVDIVLGEVDR
jgi:NADH-quinone oxidoreductase subunit D